MSSSPTPPSSFPSEVPSTVPSALPSTTSSALPSGPPLRPADPLLGTMPAWAPPSPTPEPTRSARPARVRRRPLGGALVVAAAILAGSAGGYVAGGLSGDNADPAEVAAPAPTMLTTVTAGGVDVAAVVRDAQPSVVAISTVVETRYGPYLATGEGAGTGVVLDAEGHVLTNAHVVAGATEITVTVAGEDRERRATVLGSDARRDLAVLQLVDTVGLVPATIGASDGLAVGQPVVAIGNALALAGTPTVSQGIVSALDRSITTSGGRLTGLVQTDTAISSGNSGGPLLDADARVIGINTAVAGSGGGMQANNVGFAIAIDDAMAYVDQVLATA